MRAFIFICALIACLMLAESSPLENTTVDYAAGAKAEAEMPIALVKAVPNADEQCRDIGSLCTLSEQCCTRRCHTYRERCVS